jgi:hypothetical protein
LAKIAENYDHYIDPRVYGNIRSILLAKKEIETVYYSIFGPKLMGNIV